jgi:hypothetical protein
MINWFKSLFTKRAEVVNKVDKVLTNNELWLLNRLKNDGVYLSSKGNKCYLID